LEFKTVDKFSFLFYNEVEAVPIRQLELLINLAVRSVDTFLPRFFQCSDVLGLKFLIFNFLNFLADFFDLEVAVKTAPSCLGSVVLFSNKAGTQSFQVVLRIAPHYLPVLGWLHGFNWVVR
jgi:hypothetical protein